jgi:hypothetical protein
MALMLEPGREPISMVDVPGLAHLLLRQAGERPFRLLHAKVALLGFSPVRHDGRWKLRLIVSTGNWTRQTLEDSIDLFWTIEIDSNELDEPRPADDLPARRADIAAAWRMMSFLLGLFDTSLVERGGELADGGVRAAFRDLEDWLNRASQAGKAVSSTIATAPFSLNCPAWWWTGREHAPAITLLWARAFSRAHRMKRPRPQCWAALWSACGTTACSPGRRR